MVTETVDGMTVMVGSNHSQFRNGKGQPGERQQQDGNGNDK